MYRLWILQCKITKTSMNSYTMMQHLQQRSRLLGHLNKTVDENHLVVWRTSMLPKHLQFSKIASKKKWIGMVW